MTHFGPSKSCLNSFKGTFYILNIAVYYIIKMEVFKLEIGSVKSFSHPQLCFVFIHITDSIFANQHFSIL